MENALPEIDVRIAEVLKGNVDAFRDVVNACEGQVRAVAAAIHPAKDEIDDVAQEVFLIAFKKLGTYRIGTDFTFWIKAIARNVALNARRQWYRRASRNVSIVPVEQILEGHIMELSDSMEPELLIQLRSCLDTLSDMSRAVIQMRYFEHKNSRQIGQMFRRSAMWVRHLLRSVRTELSDCLRLHGVMDQ